jgi:hypothetical protein
MREAIPEQDWRVFSTLHPVWLDRFCVRVNNKVIQLLANEKHEPYDRYSAAYKLMLKTDKEIEGSFADYRRSTAVFQIARIRKLGVITDEELARFSESTRVILDLLWK